MISESLREAYLRTVYRVFFPGEAVDIRVGGCHARLDALLGGKPWVFISAANPGSRLSEDNPARHGRLAERLASLGFECYPGLGIPDEGDWPSEESFLVFGVTEAEAAMLGREFGQNAILCGDQGKPARLVLLSG